MAKAGDHARAAVLDLGNPATRALVANYALKQLQRRIALIHAACLLTQFIARPCPPAVDELVIAVTVLDRAMRVIANTMEACIATGREPTESQCESELADCAGGEELLDRAIAALVAVEART